MQNTHIPLTLKIQVQQSSPNYGNYKKNDQEKNEHDDIFVLLRSVVNDWEILALGVKEGALDEDFLYKALRANIIRDWKRLSPLVTAYRDRSSSKVMYIEFEGLADAWEKERSYSRYSKGKKMTETRKYQLFK